MKLKALIIDDEYPAREELRYALGGFDNIEIVGEATNAQEALALIRALDYQVLFVDVSMPGIGGLEMVSSIAEMEKPPHVIFITAYEEYALQAFEVNAVDYILKPVQPGRLKKAINKVLKISRDALPASPAPSSAPEESGVRIAPDQPDQIRINKIPAEKQGRTVLISESDIFYAFTEQDYVYLKTHSEKIYTRFTLKELEARLSPSAFFRTHRCYLVNMNRVKEIIPFFNSTLNLVMEDKENSEIPVSRAQAKKLKKLLGL